MDIKNKIGQGHPRSWSGEIATCSDQTQTCENKPGCEDETNINMIKNEVVKVIRDQGQVINYL